MPHGGMTSRQAAKQPNIVPCTALAGLASLLLCQLHTALMTLHCRGCSPATAGAGVGHSSTVWEVAFDAAGQSMVSCSDDATLKVWACRKEAGVLGQGGC